MDQSLGITGRAIIGGLDPPPGVTPDYVHPHSDGMFNLVCQVVCLTASTLFVWSRMFVKARITKSLGWDDCKAPPVLINLFPFFWSGKTNNEQTLVVLHGYNSHSTRRCSDYMGSRWLTSCISLV